MSLELVPEFQRFQELRIFLLETGWRDAVRSVSARHADGANFDPHPHKERPCRKYVGLDGPCTCISASVFDVAHAQLRGPERGPFENTRNGAVSARKRARERHQALS